MQDDSSIQTTCTYKYAMNTKSTNSASLLMSVNSHRPCQTFASRIGLPGPILVEEVICSEPSQGIVYSKLPQLEREEDERIKLTLCLKKFKKNLKRESPFICKRRRGYL